MKIKLMLCLLALTTLFSCKKEPIEDDLSPASNSFMPLQVGNYWRHNEENYTEIRGTVSIKGKTFYHVYSLIGGDAFSENYLRIDEVGNLISSSVRTPDFQYIEANFNANVGDKFQTIGDQTVNDFEATVVEKTSDRMTFNFERLYHPNLKGQSFTRTFVKGFGYTGTWKEMRINGKVFHNYTVK